MKETRTIRSEIPVRLLLCSLQILHVLAWDALGATAKNNVTCWTGGSQWGDYQDHYVEGRDDNFSCGHWP